MANDPTRCAWCKPNLASLASVPLSPQWAASTSAGLIPRQAGVFLWSAKGRERWGIPTFVHCAAGADLRQLGLW